MLSREDIERIAREAVASCPPSDGDADMASDMALRRMWKALGKTNLQAAEIDRLRQDVLAAVRLEAQAALRDQDGGGGAAADSVVEETVERSFDRAEWQERVAVLVRGVFETTFDGTIQRVDAISGRARSLVEAMIASEGLSAAEAENVKCLAEDVIAAERAALI